MPSIKISAWLRHPGRAFEKICVVLLALQVSLHFSGHLSTQYRPQNCDRPTTRTRTVSEDVTILLHVDAKQPASSRARAMVASMLRLYDGVSIVLAASPSFDLSPFARFPNVTKSVVKEGETQGDIWNAMIKMVETKFVLIGRGLTYFDRDANLTRLLDILEKGSMDVAGGAFRTPDGHWFVGCQQTVMRNYSLAYTSGYSHSRNSCVFCHHVDGPFMIKTSVLASVPFSPDIRTLNVLVADLFLQVSAQERMKIAVCPDVMFHVKNKYSHAVDDWLPLGRKWDLDHIIVGNNRIQLPCPSETCPTRQYHGLAVTPCCLKVLAKQLKFISKALERNGVIHSLDSGTMLGAIKFNGILPWELDGDIRFATENKTALLSMHDFFRKNGYKVTPGDFKGQDHLYGPNSTWKMELLEEKSLDYFDGRNYSYHGLRPTRVNLDGAWMPSVPNPGLYVYKEYHHEIYRHSQHNEDYGELWSRPYKGARHFMTCRPPAHHACLDQYLTDGNLQFAEPRVSRTLSKD